MCEGTCVVRCCYRMLEVVYILCCYVIVEKESLSISVCVGDYIYIYIYIYIQYRPICSFIYPSISNSSSVFVSITFCSSVFLYILFCSYLSIHGSISVYSSVLFCSYHILFLFIFPSYELNSTTTFLLQVWLEQKITHEG